MICRKGIEKRANLKAKVLFLGGGQVQFKVRAGNSRGRAPLTVGECVALRGIATSRVICGDTVAEK